MSGKFIVFEGIDNSGKTTISTQIHEWLKLGAIDNIITRHPGSTPIGQELRQILKHSPEPINANAQALLFAADNSLFMNQILKPNLDKGTWVLGDRNNFISSLAYQIASGCSLEELDMVHNATLQVAKIDLLFLFTCSWETTQIRKKAREAETGIVLKDRYEDAGKAYFDKLQDCYQKIAVDARLTKFINNPNNVVQIDATQPQSDVLEQVKLAIVSRLIAPRLFREMPAT